MEISVGEYLRRMREVRGLTLDQVSQATRISLFNLQALENDEIFLLSSKVQGKGFLRLYADTLKINVQPLLNSWPDRNLEFPTPDETTQPGRNKKTDYSVSETGVTVNQGLIPGADQTKVETIEESAHLLSKDRPTPPPDSQLLFNQIGEKLRRQRETLNLSINDIERFTRLRAQNISALEQGRLEELPSLVQARGMLSNYAEFMNMDTDTLLLLFADALQSRRIERTQAETTKSPPAESKSKKPPSRQAAWRRMLTPDLLMGGSLFILLVAFVVWGAARIVDMQRQQALPTPQSISEILMSTETEIPLSLMQTQTAEATPTTITGDNIPAPPIPENEVVDTGQPAIEPSVLNTAPIQVYVVASQRAWLQVVVDNQVAFAGRVVPGNAYPFSGFEQIELTTGNAAGVQVFFNQNNLGTLGGVGEVVHLIFTDEGTLVPTPQFTFTPTPTLTPTASPTPTATVPTPTITPFIP